MKPLIGLLATIAFCQQSLAPTRADEPSRPPDRIVIRKCETSYKRSSLLGSATHGVLQDCLVELGDHVKANQVLGRLFDKDVRAEAELFRVKCESDLEIRLCEAKHAESLGKLKASKSLRLRNMMSNEDYTLDQLDATTCELELQGARFDARLNEIRYRHAMAVAKAREIVTPHDGVVEAVFRRQNETVSPTEPAFHVVDIRRVRVMGDVDVSDVWRVRSGQSVQVMPEVEGADLAIEQEMYRGRVVFIDQIIDAKKQTCRVIAEVENVNEQLRAGLDVRMEIYVLGGHTLQAKPTSDQNVLTDARPEGTSPARVTEPAGELERKSLRSRR